MVHSLFLQFVVDDKRNTQCCNPEVSRRYTAFHSAYVRDVKRV